MKFNEALAKLAPTKGDGAIARPGRPAVRNAVGTAEQTLHRYVTDAEPVEAFDATPEDLEATDWTLGDSASKKKKDAEAKAAEEAAAKTKGPKKE